MAQHDEDFGRLADFTMGRVSTRPVLKPPMSAEQEFREKRAVLN